MKSTSPIQSCIQILPWSAPSFPVTCRATSSLKSRSTPRATSSNQRSSRRSATESTKRSKPRCAAGTTSRPRSTARQSPPGTTYTSIFRHELGLLDAGFPSCTFVSLVVNALKYSYIRHLFAYVLNLLPIPRRGDRGANNDAQSNQPPEEIRSRDGCDHRARRSIPYAVWRAHISVASRVDPLSAVERQSRSDHLQSIHCSCRRSADAKGHSHTDRCRNARRRAVPPEDGVSARSLREDPGWPSGVRAHAGTAGRRSDRASHPGQGRRRLDGAHVPDVHVAASGYSPDRRLRRAGCHQEALQETQMAQARGDGEDRETVGALSLDRVLVSLEKLGY